MVVGQNEIDEVEGSANQEPKAEIEMADRESQDQKRQEVVAERANQETSKGLGLQQKDSQVEELKQYDDEDEDRRV